MSSFSKFYCDGYNLPMIAAQKDDLFQRLHTSRPESNHKEFLHAKKRHPTTISIESCGKYYFSIASPRNYKITLRRRQTGWFGSHREKHHTHVSTFPEWSMVYAKPSNKSSCPTDIGLRRYPWILCRCAMSFLPSNLSILLVAQPIAKGKKFDQVQSPLHANVEWLIRDWLLCCIAKTCPHL